MIRDQYNKKHFSTACVTGASSGIGEALSRELAGRGIDLMLAGRNVARLNALAEELRSKVDVHIFPGDLSVKDDRAMLISNIHHYVPDLIVNNAGIGLYGDALTYETADQMKLLYVNVDALMEVSLEGARAMVTAKKRGVIVNVSSVAGYVVFPGFSAYAASKAFVNMFSESFDVEMKQHGIRILSACPGVVATRFQNRAAGKDDGLVSNVDVMTPEFAAGEIWDQIQTGKKIRVFDWKYRLIRYLLYFVPNSIVAKIMYRYMKSRVGERQIIER